MINSFSNPSLDARLQGIIPRNNANSIVFVTPSNEEKTFTWVFPYDCQFNGVEIFCYQANFGDIIKTFETKYSIDNGQTYSKRYKRFGKNYPLIGGYVNRIVLFPTKPKINTSLFITIKNNGEIDNKLAIGIFIFVDQERVKVSENQEGKDW